MAEIACRCGKSRMNFQRLEEKDLPQGWENECCAEAAKKPEPKAEAEKPAPAKEEPKPAAPEAPKKKNERKKK